MRRFNKDGEIEFGDILYNAVTLRGRKLVLEKITKTGIYLNDVKKKFIERKISKNGTIRIEGETIDVMNIDGLEFHLKWSRCI